MKTLPILAAAGLAAAAAIPVAAPVEAQRVVVVDHGPPGPGWTTWTERRVAGPGWAGPAYYTGPGRHHGYYRWRNGYYRNCGWRARGHGRDWRCW